MHSDSTVVRAGARGVPRPALVLLACGIALCLAVENTILLWVLGPSLPWPEPLALALRVGRVIAAAFAPWLAAGAASALVAAGALWAVLRVRREVHHA